MYVCVRMRVCVEIIITAVHNVQEYMHTHTHKATHVHIDSATYSGYQEQRPLCVCSVSCVCLCLRTCVREPVRARICSSNAYLTDKMSTFIQHPKRR